MQNECVCWLAKSFKGKLKENVKLSATENKQNECEKKSEKSVHGTRNK